MRLLKELVDKTFHNKGDTTFVSVRFQYRKKVENFLNGKGVIDYRSKQRYEEGAAVAQCILTKQSFYY